MLVSTPGLRPLRNARGSSHHGSSGAHPRAANRRRALPACSFEDRSKSQQHRFGASQSDRDRSSHSHAHHHHHHRHKHKRSSANGQEGYVSIQEVAEGAWNSNFGRGPPVQEMAEAATAAEFAKLARKQDDDVRETTELANGNGNGGDDYNSVGMAAVVANAEAAAKMEAEEGDGSDDRAGNSKTDAVASTSDEPRPKIPGVKSARAHTAHAAVYDVVHVAQDGTLNKKAVQRRELLHVTGLQPRDLRRIDPHLSLTNSAPVIVVRDGVLLVHVASIRVAVFANYCISFTQSHSASTNGALQEKFLERLSQRLVSIMGIQIMKRAVEVMHYSTGTSLTYTNQQLMYGSADRSSAITASIYNNASSELDSMGTHSESTLFELEVLEAALHDATTELELMLNKSTTRVEELLKIRPSRMNAYALEKLRTCKQELVEIDARAGAMRQMLLETLDDEEDIKNMLISRVGLERTEAEVEADAEEVESMLEYHLQRCEAYHSEAERLLENMRDLEESVSLSLSARRFEVSKLELLLSVLSFAVANGALVAGIFGMNLLSGLEMAPQLFWWVTGGIVVSIVAITAAVFVYISSRISTQASTKVPDHIRKQHQRAMRGEGSWRRFFKIWRSNSDVMPTADEVYTSFDSVVASSGTAF